MPDQDNTNTNSNGQIDPAKDHNDQKAPNGQSDPNPATQTASNGEEYAAIKAELDQTQAKFNEMTNIAKQALADLQNSRRRAEEENRNTIIYANTDLLKDLLPAINNIDRALNHEPKDAEWSKGVEQTLKQLWQTLGKKNVSIIPTVGEALDPRKHEVLMVGPGEKDIITKELEKGYMLGDRVLKPARVQVGNGETQLTT